MQKQEGSPSEENYCGSCANFSLFHADGITPIGERKNTDGTTTPEGFCRGKKGLILSAFGNRLYPDTLCRNPGQYIPKQEDAVTSRTNLTTIPQESSL